MRNCFYLPKDTRLDTALQLYTDQEKQNSQADYLSYLDPSIADMIEVKDHHETLDELITRTKRGTTIIVWRSSQIKNVDKIKKAIFSQRYNNVVIRILDPEIIIDPNDRHSANILQAWAEMEKTKPSPFPTANIKPDEVNYVPNGFGIPRLADSIVEALRKEKREGATVNQLCEKYGVGRTSVAKYTKGIKSVKPIIKEVLEDKKEKKFDYSCLDFGAIDSEMLTYEVAKDFLEYQRTESTRNTYYTDLKRFFKWGESVDRIFCEPHYIKEKDGIKYLSWLKESGYSATMIHRAFAVVSSFLGYCKKRDWVVTNEIALVKLPRKDRYKIESEPLEKSELNKVLSHLLNKVKTQTNPERKRVWHRNFVGVYLLSNVGMRMSSLLSLRVKCVKMRSGITYLTLIAKASDDYKVAIDSRSARILNNYMELYLKDEDGSYDPKTFVFYSDEEKKTVSHVHEDLINRAIKEACEQVGINKRITSHSMRTTYATLSARAGMNLKELQRRMGHKNFQMTLAYIKLADTAVENEWVGDFMGADSLEKISDDGPTVC